MPIRSGTGGLKYPLPANTDNQASIAAASSGGSAAASAYGANRSFAANKMRVQADILNSERDRQLRAQENYFDRGFRAQAQLQEQGFRADQSELNRTFDAERQQAQFDQQTALQQSGQTFSAGQAELDRGFTTQRDQFQADQRNQAFEREVDAGIESDVRSGKLELTPEAQMRLNQIEGDMAAIAAQDHLTPEQKQEFQVKADEKRRELMRTARAPRRPTAAQQANQGQVFQDQETGQYHDQYAPGRVAGSVTDKGFVPSIQKPDTSKQDERQQKWVDERADDLMETEKEPGKMYTAEEAARQASKDWDAREKGFQPPPAQTPASQFYENKGYGLPPTQPAQGQVFPVASDVNAMEGGVVPEGFPKETKVMGVDTYQLPDGRIVRGKGK